MSCHVKRSHRAFTLTEVVIGLLVLGILATAGVFAYNRWQRSTWRAVLVSDLSRFVREEETRRTSTQESPTDTTRPLALQPQITQLVRSQRSDRYWLVLRHDGTDQTCWAMMHPDFPVEGNGVPNCGPMPDTTAGPVGPVGQAPTADLTVTPSSIVLGQSVTLSGAGSTDPDGTIVSYQFSGMPGLPPAGPTPTISVTPTTAGVSTLVLRVVDDQGNPALTSRSLEVLSLPPDAGTSTITATPLMFPQGDSTEVLVTVRATNNSPVVGAPVVLSTTGASTLLRQPSGGTNSAGEARGWVRGLAPGTVVISASAGGVPLQQTATVTVGPPPIDATTSTLTATPPNVLVNQFSALTVTVRSATNTPLPGVNVTLAATGPAGFQLVQPDTVTDLSGVTTGYLRHPLQTGTFVVSATAGGVPLTATATVTVEGRRPTRLVVVEGQNQAALANTPVGIAPRVRVLDQANLPLPNEAVLFSVSSGGGTVTGATGLTDAGGELAVGSWVLGATGAQTLQALADTARTSITATLNVPSTLVLVEGGSQRVRANSPVPIAPQVEVRNASSAPMAGVTVTFTASGGSATGTTVVTDAAGRARVGSWTTGGGATGQVLRAQVTGVPNLDIPVTISVPTTLTFINPVTGVSLGAAPTQSWAPLSAVTPVPMVEVVDQDGAVMTGVSVNFTQTGGLTLGAASATTDFVGRATPTSVTLPSGSGSRTLVATVAGVPTATRTLTLSALQANSVVLVSGGGQTLVMSDGPAFPATLPQPFVLRAMSLPGGAGVPVPGARIGCWTGSSSQLRVNGATLSCNNSGGSPIAGTPIGVTDATGELRLGTLTVAGTSGANPYGDFSAIGGTPAAAANSAIPTVVIRIRRPFAVVPVTTGVTANTATPWTATATSQDTTVRRAARGGAGLAYRWRVVDSTGAAMGSGWTVNVTAGGGPGWNSVPATASTNTEGEFTTQVTPSATADAGYFQSSTWTENRRTLQFQVPAQRSVAAAPHTMTFTTIINNVRRVEPVTGFGQAVPTTADVQTLQFRLRDAVNAPVASHPVTAVAQSAASLLTRPGGGSYTSDADGVVTIPAGTFRSGTGVNGTRLDMRMTLGYVWSGTVPAPGSPAGWQSGVSGSGGPATWDAYAYLSAPTGVVVLSDSAQTGALGQTLRPVRIRVVNASNQGVAGAVIQNIAVSGGDGTYTGPATITADAAGEASIGPWGFGTTAGAWTGTAATMTIQVVGMAGTRTIATARRVTPVLTILSGNNQVRLLGEALAPVVVEARDNATNELLANLPVTVIPTQNMTFTAPGLIETDASGRATLTGLAVSSTWDAWSVSATANVTVPGSAPVVVTALQESVTFEVVSGNGQRLFPRECTYDPVVLRVTRGASPTPIASMAVGVRTPALAAPDRALYQGADTVLTDVDGTATLPAGSFCMHGRRDPWASGQSFTMELRGGMGTSLVNLIRVVPTPVTVTLPPVPPGGGTFPVFVPYPRDPVTDRPCPPTVCTPVWEGTSPPVTPVDNPSNPDAPAPGAPMPGGPLMTPDNTAGAWRPSGGAMMMSPIVEGACAAYPNNMNPHDYSARVSYEDGTEPVFRIRIPIAEVSYAVPFGVTPDRRNWGNVGDNLTAGLRVYDQTGMEVTGQLVAANCVTWSVSNTDGVTTTGVGNYISVSVPSTSLPNRGPGTSPAASPQVAVAVRYLNYTAAKSLNICRAPNSYPDGSLYCPGQPNQAPTDPGTPPTSGGWRCAWRNWMQNHPGVARYLLPNMDGGFGCLL